MSQTDGGHLSLGARPILSACILDLMSYAAFIPRIRSPGNSTMVHSLVRRSLGAARLRCCAM